MFAGVQFAGVQAKEETKTNPIKFVTDAHFTTRADAQHFRTPRSGGTEVK